ncbi:hypothetical protein BEL04_04245 [Mucilaginibacter sp. PPCGB 2223]|uniref:HYC_CC_PP family protein n=1 Tax=Mucilaginibacter sp. PPCGB 2223 TaxID=1886027 RepID=UPI0008258FA0|nr:hypothetical protein [Mucilaginibacter sp. PPCGB 2223]OCX53517.1 hypothetical protein BEL04_04245 [Mucilaginibacter sp. PPCGB 2223]
MKRIVVIVLTAVYLFSSLGVAAKSMYCSGVLTSTTIAYSDHSKEKCKMGVEMRKCCKTKRRYLKVKDQHYGSATLAFLAKLFPVFSHFSSTDTVLDEPCLYRLHAYNSKAPPSAFSTPTYILHCTYRI